MVERHCQDIVSLHSPYSSPTGSLTASRQPLLFNVGKSEKRTLYVSMGLAKVALGSPANVTVQCRVAD